MAHFGRRDINYSALNNESSSLAHLLPPEPTTASPTLISLEPEHEDATNVIIHTVPQTKGMYSVSFILYMI